MMERMAVLKIDFEGTSHLTEEFLQGSKEKNATCTQKMFKSNTERKQRKSEERVY